MKGEPTVWRRLGRACGAVAAAALLGNSRVAAQCAMCGLGAEQAAGPDKLLWTFGSAVLILLIPSFLILLGMGILIFKARHWDGAIHEPDGEGNLVVSLNPGPARGPAPLHGGG
ncbi:MAG: hypothetical protein ACE5ID_12135 [Acidobacteriota bacterium]